MPFQPSQPFHEYLLAPWDKIEQLFTDWSRIGERLGNTELHSRSLWAFAAHIHTALQAAHQDPKNYILDPVEKSVLRFVDPDIARRFLDGMAEMETALRQNTGEPAGAALPPAFEALDVEPDIAAQWKEWFRALPEDLQGVVSGAFEGLQADALTLYYQLAHAAVVWGFYLPLPAPYTMQEFSENVLGKEEGSYDWKRLTAQFVDATRNGEDAQELALEAADMFGLELIYKRQQYTWEEAYFLMLALHLLFARSVHLSMDYQMFLVMKYGYRAIMLDIPVRERIAESLYLNTHTPIDYVVENAKFIEALEGNDERLAFAGAAGSTATGAAGAGPAGGGVSAGTAVSPAGAVSPSLAGGQDAFGAPGVFGGPPVAATRVRTDTVGGFLSSFKDRLMESASGSADAFAQQTFVQQLYEGQKYRDIFLRWLREVGYIYIRVKNGTLIEKNIGAELDPRDEAHNDIALLTSFVGTGDVARDRVIAYFKRPERHVALSGFVGVLARVMDLSREDHVENCVKLDEALHAEGLLPDDEHIIEFHESDGQFYFNPRVQDRTFVSALDRALQGSPAAAT